jgi:hypothetical protein
MLENKEVKRQEARWSNLLMDNKIADAMVLAE